MAASDTESVANGPVYVLGDLLNLSLGTPEVGAVNFNILKVLLRELINGAGLTKKAAALNEPEVNHITMYQKCVEGEQSVGKLPGVVATGSNGSKGVKIGPKGATYSSNSSQYKIPDKGSEVARDPSTTDTGANRMNPSELEEKVHNLERHLQNLYALPENKELLAPDNDSTKVTDMWQHIQLNNRVAATEAAVQKLASLIEDLMKKLKDLEGCCGSDINNMKEKLDDFAEKAGLNSVPSFMQTAEAGTDPESRGSTANVGTGADGEDGANNTSSADTNTENYQQDGSNQTDGTGTGAAGTSTDSNDSSNNGSNTESGSGGQDGADGSDRGSKAGVDGEDGSGSGQGADAGLDGATVGADGTVIGADGEVIGTVGEDGKIIAPDGTVVGTIGADGKIIGADRKEIGTVGADGKVKGADGAAGAAGGAGGADLAGRQIFGPDGKLLGTVDKDGNIIGPDGKVVGTIGPDGKIYDADGKLIGTLGADGKIIDPDGKVIGTLGNRKSVGPGGRSRSSRPSGAGTGRSGSGSGSRGSRSASRPGGRGIEECLEGMCSQTDRAMASRATFAECNQATNTSIPVCDESDLECKRKALEETMKNSYCDIQRMQRTIMCDMQKRMECMYQKLLGDIQTQNNTPICPPEMCNQGVGRCGGSYRSLTPSPRSRACSPCATVGSASPCSPRSRSPRCCPPTYPNQKVLAVGGLNQFSSAARSSRRISGQPQSRDPSPSTEAAFAETSKAYEQPNQQSPRSSEVQRNSQGFEVQRTSQDSESLRAPPNSGVQRTSRSARRSPCRPKTPSSGTGDISKATEYVQRASQISEAQRASQIPKVQRASQISEAQWASQISEVQRASQTSEAQRASQSSEIQRMSQGPEASQTYRSSEAQGRAQSSENQRVSQGLENQQMSPTSETPRFSQNATVQRTSQGSQVRRKSQCSEAQKTPRSMIVQRSSRDPEAQRISQNYEVQQKSQGTETRASQLPPVNPTSPKGSAATNPYIPNESKSPKKCSVGNDTMRVFKFAGTEIRTDNPRPSPANSYTSANRPKSALVQSDRSDSRYGRNEMNQTEAAAEASANDGLLIDALQKDCKNFVLLPKDLEDFRTQVTKQGKVPTVFDEKEVIEKLFTLWDAVMALKQNDESLAVRVMKLDSAVRCLSAVKPSDRQTNDIKEIRRTASVSKDRYSQGYGVGPEKQLLEQDFEEPRESKDQTSRNRASSTTCLSLQRKDCYMLGNNNCDRRKLSNLAASTGPRLSNNSGDMKMRDLDMRLNKTDEVYEMMKNLEGSMVTRDSLMQTLKDNASLMDNKVNLEDFACAMDDLTNRMQNMAIEVYQKNDAWKAMLEHLADEIHCKLDKGELATIRAYFKSHLKGLENKVNQLMCELNEPDPAGTRKKLLKDYNCISCDRRTNISGVTNAPLIPYLRPATAGVCLRTTTSQRTLEMPRFSDRPRTSTTKGNRSCRRPEVNYYAKATACCPIGDTADVNQMINRYTGGSHTCFSNAERLAGLRKRTRLEFLCDTQERQCMNPPEATEGPLEDETDYMESEHEQQVHDTVETTNLVSLQNEQEETEVNNE